MDALILNEEKRKKKKHLRHYTSTLSFSASLPDDVQGIYADSLCAVKYSMDPLLDLKESIIDMVKNVGVRNWEDLEELIYCYVVLNSSDIHGFIVEAFLSLCCS
ncbi:hypothetical protein AQUCO_03700303v1 [Aquilegia coerulea]|uniref:Transcription repressor n=1 Tax=Aquilegia coerulea TaxID=218851 RepID=A0A2G5CUJ5_AQUCA|nr:hypothetical protein AQUCO_03700303v1 [Aquilegia coerulea]